MKELNDIIEFLETTLKEHSFKDIENFLKELNNLKTKTPTIEELEELRKQEVDLEVKYEVLTELANYFAPLYVKIKNQIHNDYVKKLREENRKKRKLKKS